MPKPWNPRLPLRQELWTSPQVLRICHLTGLDRWGVVARVTRVWVEAQLKANENGTLEGKTLGYINAMTEQEGFAEAMIAAGWLVLEDSGVRIPEFDAFVSKRAIRRIEKSDWQQLRRTDTTDSNPPLKTECGPYVDLTTPYSIPPAATTTPEPETKVSKKKQKKDKVVPAEYTPEFELFWAAYPRKDGKLAAAKIYLALKPDADLQGRMLAAVQRQSTSEQWTRDDGRFIPHASTWLNNRRWEDEGPDPSRPVAGSPRVSPRPGQFNSRRDLSKEQTAPAQSPAAGAGATLF